MGAAPTDGGRFRVAGLDQARGDAGTQRPPRTRTRTSDPSWLLHFSPRSHETTKTARRTYKFFDSSCVLRVFVASWLHFGGVHFVGWERVLFLRHAPTRTTMWPMCARAG